MGVFGAPRGEGNTFDRRSELEIARLRAKRRGDTLGAKTFSQQIGNLKKKQRLGFLNLKQAFGGHFNRSEQGEFDLLRRANLRRLRRTGSS